MEIGQIIKYDKGNKIYGEESRYLINGITNTYVVDEIEDVYTGTLFLNDDDRNNIYYDDVSIAKIDRLFERAYYNTPNLQWVRFECLPPKNLDKAFDKETIVVYPRTNSDIFNAWEKLRLNSNDYPNIIFKPENPSTDFSITGSTINSVTNATARNSDYLIVPKVINGNTITKIKGNVNNYFVNLKHVVIPSTVLTVDSFAFYRCNNLSTINLPKTLVAINNQAFTSCEMLTSINIPDTVQYIGDYSFYKSNRISSLTIPNNIEIISDRAFPHCNNLTELTIGNSVTSIEYRAFYGCTKLENIYIPNNVETIGEETFYNCNKVKKLYIGNGITNIGNNAFLECPIDAKIRFKKNSNDVRFNIGDYPFGFENNTKIICEDRVLTVGQEPTTLDNFGYYSTSNNYYTITSFTTQNNSLFIPETIEGYSVDMNYNYTYNETNKINIDRIFIASSVKTIGNNAFVGSNISSITFPHNLIKVGDKSFAKCNKLSVVNVNSRLQNIGDYAFSEIQISTINLPDTISNIGIGAFNSCVNLDQIIIPFKTNNIKTDTFKNCTNVTQLNIHKNVTSIGAGAFYNVGGNISDKSLTKYVIDIPSQLVNQWDWTITGIGFPSQTQLYVKSDVIVIDDITGEMVPQYDIYIIP